MIHDIGDTVVPVVNVPSTYPGDPEMLTAGVSGTVLSRKTLGVDENLNDKYTYEVDMSEDFYFNSGTMSVSVFWFSEEDLGGAASSLYELLDVGSILVAIDEANTNAAIAVSTADDVMAHIDKEGPFYYSASGINSAIKSFDETLKANIYMDLSSEEGISETANGALQNAKHQNINLVIFKDIIENLKGYDDAVRYVNEELQTAQDLSLAQIQKANEDDELNYQAYLAAYVEAPIYQNQLSPLPDGEEYPDIPDAPPPTPLPVFGLDQGDD